MHGEVEDVTPERRSSRPAKNTLVRRLALAKLRELRRFGLSYREIGVQFGLDQARVVSEAGGFAFRLPPERLLASALGASADVTIFLRALDAVDHGLAFFDCSGALVHANRAVSRVLETGPAGEQLRVEIQQFVGSICRVIRMRRLDDEPMVEEISVLEVPTEEEHYRLRGSFVGLDLFGQGVSVLVTVERPNSTLFSAAALRERFGLSKQESRIAHLLARGKSNAEIAKTLFISPHTARTHTQRILDKLGVHSRAEVATRILM